jgi:hypothetical protein
VENDQQENPWRIATTPNLCPNVVNENLDEHGNQFRYRAKVKDQHGAQVSRWAWDVFLIVTP